MEESVRMFFCSANVGFFLGGMNTASINLFD